MAVRSSLKQWTVRDELLVATHRWYIILAFILSGSLLAAILAYVLPSPFRATADIYVGLNDYRAAEDAYIDAFANFDFTNPDDYKHWQMSQLSLLILTDDYLGGTLSRLQAEDPYWSQVEVGSLREMLHAYWRNAGEWRLVAENSDPNHAAQAAGIWRAVIFEKTASAIANSRELFAIDLRLKEISREQIETNTRQVDLEKKKEDLAGWRETLSKLPPEEPLVVEERWHLLSLVGSAAGLNPGWGSVLENAPGESVGAAAYLPWLDQVLPAVDQELADLQNRSQALEQDHSDTMAKWEAAFEAGHGLSATLTVEAPSNEPPSVSAERPVSAALIIGGLVGLLAWGIFTLVRTSRGALA